MLQHTKISLQAYQEIRDRHYVSNNGCIGKQIHYLIFLDGYSFAERPIGIISGASPVYACKSRDEYFDITNDNRIDVLDKIINNVVFRLEVNIPNLASHILSVWRKQITKDWYDRYSVIPIGFETFVYGESRTGASYKADNWTYVGMTKGIARRKRKAGSSINSGIIMREHTQPKLIFCRWV